MKRRNRDEWREICAASDASALTNRAFAESMDIKPGTLSYWRCKLREELGCTTEFVEVHAADADGDGEIIVDVGGVRLTLAALPPAEWLAELARLC